MLILLLISAFTIPSSSLQNNGCAMNNFRSWAPVVLSSDSRKILYPPAENQPKDRNITIPVGKSVIISCHMGHFSSTGLEKSNSKTIIATCNLNAQLESQDQILDFDKVSCINFEPVIVQLHQKPSCAPNSKLVDIGFRIGLNIDFIPQIGICFDLTKRIALYSNYNLTKSIGSIGSYLVTSYKTDYALYGGSGINISALYEMDYQQQTINEIVGLPNDSTKYINPKSCHPQIGLRTPGFCIKMRPLAYRGEFVFISQQYATYRYVNVVPQWSFIDYNWEKMERNVIDFAKSNQFDLEVYTGTYGVATLPHEGCEEPKELYLNNGTIPVPLFLWKLIYHAESRDALVLVVVNDPYQKNIEDNILCRDISDSIEWLKWDKKNVTKGYSYACTYPEIKAKITYLPDLIVNGSFQ